MHLLCFNRKLAADSGIWKISAKMGNCCREIIIIVTIYIYIYVVVSVS